MFQYFKKLDLKKISWIKIIFKVQYSANWNILFLVFSNASVINHFSSSDDEAEEGARSAAEDVESDKEAKEDGETSNRETAKVELETSDQDIPSDAESEKAGSDNEEDAGDQLIADIFGSSDEEEFEVWWKANTSCLWHVDFD